MLVEHVDTTALDSAVRKDRREAIFRAQEELAKFTQDMPPVKHYFAPGAYAREMLIPKDRFIIGKIHKHAHLNIIQYGRIKVYTEFETLEFQGPMTFVSQPGTKRVVYALEDTLWTTIHVTEETDLEKIEDHVIAKTYEQIGMLCDAENEAKGALK